MSARAGASAVSVALIPRLLGRPLVLYSRAVRLDRKRTRDMAESSTPLFGGVDLGGTNIRACIATADGTIRSQVRVPTRASEGPEAVISRIVASVRQAAARAGAALDLVCGVGVGAPGPINMDTGVVYHPPNLTDWQDVPLQTLLQQQLDRPVKIGNDANLAAVGEHAYGAGRGIADMVYITVSTGVGAGAIIGGKLLVGTTGAGAEVGHITILMHGPRCGCGNEGCLEALAAGPAIARAGQAAARAHPTSRLAKLAAAPEQVTTALVVEAARAGDPVAQAVFAQAAEALGVGCLNVVHMFNPRRIIIGGGVSQAGDLLFEPVRQVVLTRALINARHSCDIVPAALGDDAGLYGAVALVARGIKTLA